MNPINWILTLIRYALILGTLGGLIDVTLMMAKETAHAQKHGLISLRAINRALFSR